MKTFIVVGNIGEHSGFVATENAEDIWDNENPGGWTYQQVTGPHGTVLGEYDNAEEADRHLAKFLECDSVEKGRYCYTHNPYPSRD